MNEDDLLVFNDAPHSTTVNIKTFHYLRNG